MKTKLWMVLPLVLLCSCSTLTPERVTLIAAIAGQAAQVGLQIWLSKHPDQRGLIEAVLAGLSGATGGGTITKEEAATALSFLPDTLRSAEGELYTSTNRIVIWDNKVGKAHLVTDAEAYEVIRKVQTGIRLALQQPAPMPRRVTSTRGPVRPPMPVYDSVPVEHWRRYFQHPNAGFVRTNPPYTLELQGGVYYQTNTTDRTTNGPGGWFVTMIEGKPHLTWTNGLPIVESPTPVPAGKFRSRAGIYVVERKGEGTNWIEAQAISGPVGEYRVRRKR